MQRRHFIPVLLSLVPVSARAAEPTAGSLIRGRILPGGAPPKLKLNSGEVVTVAGDDQTLAVLKDPRVIAYEVELAGHYEQPGRFAVNPIHKPALFAFKDGHRYQVSYWCPVCSIRSYSPGKCWCCQEETHLDLIEPPSP